MIIITSFRCQVYLTGERPTYWGHHFYHSKVEGDMSHDKHTHIKTDTSLRANGLTKTRRPNHFHMLEQRQHLLLSYFKTLSVGPAGNRTRASRTTDWRLTNKANQTAVFFVLISCFSLISYRAFKYINCCCLLFFLFICLIILNLN